MPSIKDRLGKPAGFVAVDSLQGPPPSSPNTAGAVGVNPFIRCPLPPLNVNSDTLRQFDESGKIPTRRVIPLPISTVAGNAVTNNNVVTTTPSGGGSSGGTSLVAKSVNVVVPALAPGASFRTNVQMSKSFQLLQAVSNQPVEVRIYGSANAQSADGSRLTDSPVAFESQSGIVSDIVFDTPPYTWAWQNRVGANADSSTSATIYVSVINPGSIGVPPSQITIQYLPLET